MILYFVFAATHSLMNDNVITSDQLPFVCQTIEVTTENEDQVVRSSQTYPLQISPISSHCGETYGPPLLNVFFVFRLMFVDLKKIYLHCIWVISCAHWYVIVINVRIFL